ncbi:EAL domain-containing response regulator [Polymorphobacter multimanifer]|uniref:EAL domain-containing response regulator n=1 Tax=Polymorphobacter multimanifer TaxID=1070431 RepID=UPI001669838F|nr:EAL domain-containing response regulator [Polymorphobacter multimanifer]
MASPARHLLVLDDDASIGTTIAYIGEQVGMIVSTVQTPEAFETALDAFGADVIILDLLMPGCDGIEMLHRLHARGCTADIIVNSGVEHRVLEAAGRTARELGLNLLGILPKPFSPRTLRAMLRSSETASAPEQAPRPRGATAPHLGIMLPCVAEIDAGLLAHQFHLDYQPKIHCASGELEGFEALVRWDHPMLGMLTPEKFLALVESTQRIDELTSQVIDQALAWLAALADKRPLGMAINLSPRSLGNIELADLIEAKCVEAGIDPARITLEITEASAMEDPIAGLAVTTRFCMKAFKLAIDDFGVGYSSLVQLARLPFAELKIDRQFVQDLPDSADSRAIVEAIVLLAHRLGLAVTAEGVENTATLKYLAAIGCDTAQGFAIARPMDGNSARAWVEAHGPAEPWPERASA